MVLIVDIEFAVTRQKSYCLSLFSGNFENSRSEFVLQVSGRSHNRQNLFFTTVADRDTHIDIRNFRFILFHDIDLDFRDTLETEFLFLSIVKFSRIHKIDLEFLRECVVLIKYVSDIATDLRDFRGICGKVSGDRHNIIQRVQHIFSCF